MHEWEEIYCLAKYNKIIRLIKKIISNVDHLQKNDSNTHNIPNISKPSFHELGMTWWRRRPINGIRQGFIVWCD